MASVDGFHHSERRGRMRDNENKVLTLTRDQLQLIEAGGEIRLSSNKAEAAFMARQLVQATLPHKNPGDVPAWTRCNGRLTLTIRPGWDGKKNAPIGYPYGTIPRLLLFWITTEAVKTKSRRLELGNSLNAFMSEIGLSRVTGGGKRGVAARLKNQMDRLFNSIISFESPIEKNGRTGEGRINMTVASRTTFWWNTRDPDQATLWGSYIELGAEFFEALTAAPVPVDTRALKVLKRSPLALDLYAWATYTAYQTHRSGQSRSLSWELLHSQFGGEYHDMKEFGKSARAALRKVQAVYPALELEFVKGGLTVLPCNPAVTIKT